MFHVFGYQQFSASGGMGDYRGSFDRFADAKAEAENYFFSDVAFVGHDGKLHVGWSFYKDTKNGTVWEADAELAYLTPELRRKLDEEEESGGQPDAGPAARGP